ncbi:thioredoxin family protein [Youngiibacter fragilis]|jgi:small redox-active disulfide protein 2|uniref:Redox-active disulfide protein n=1 Tax=Youngiibacter fragilis 232.1 TaxID=994573 RepID=V7I113_9CLOT|nr:thioredoxin family protein [Youngiibacter fragilis]ETA79935.1 redox-active disulfide protein [Youngiibacter fragilis 232.1]
MILKILGTGCANCRKLEANVREAVKEMGLDAEVKKVENIKDIMSYGVMGTPALVKDEKVLFAGRVPNVDAIKKYIAE